MPSCRLPLQGGCVKRVMKPATSKTRTPRRRGWSNLGSRFKDERDHRHEGRRLCRAINPDGKCPDDCMAPRGNTTNRVLRLWFEARLLGIVQLAGQQHRLIEVI